MIPNHTGKRVVNQTTHWFGMDSEEIFLSHINDPQKKELLEKYGWTDPECILYRHNSHGFRCNEFDSRPAGLALGSSVTHGVGINEDQAWPAVLSNLLNIHIWNLGVGGAAYDTVFRLLDYYLVKLKPKFVVIFEPPKSRFEIARNKNDFEVLNPNSTQYNNITYKNWFANDENLFFNHRKNQLACRYICQQNSVPIFQWNSEDPLYSLNCVTNLARDLNHPGPSEHKQLAYIMFDEIKNLL